LNLKMEIVASGKTQRQIAAACGIAENRFSSIIHGWVMPREREREAIAATLGKPVDHLFERPSVSL
jgi:transcriptional regulator with XRE-family HTH domain